MDHLLLENPVTKSFDGGEAGIGMTLEQSPYSEDYILS